MRRTQRGARGWPHLAIAAAVAVLVTAGCAAHGGGSAAPTVGTAGQRAIPSSIAGLPFVDDHGTTTTIASLHGKTVVLTDFLTLCQEICPLTSANLRQVDDAVARSGRSSDIVLVEVTVDPARDTPARLAAYRKVVGAASNWLFLTGSAENVAALWKWFGVAYEKTPQESPAPTDWWTGEPLTYDVGHSDALFFIDPQGEQRYVVAGAPAVSGAALPSPLAGFLNDEGRANLASPSADSWTAAGIEQVLSWLTGHRIRAS